MIDVFSLNVDVFSLVIDAFSLDVDVFSLVIDAFSLDVDVFSLVIDVFSLNVDVFSLELDVFVLNFLRKGERFFSRGIENGFLILILYPLFPIPSSRIYVLF